MTSYGTVIAYDPGRSAGVLSPDGGGAPIVFATADQRNLRHPPRLLQRYGFTVLAPRDGGQARAVNLSLELSHRQQAEAQPG